MAGLTLLYTAASLLHFAHNAEYLRDYPNLPEWLTRREVYAAWAGLTAIGIAGFVIYRIGWPFIGLVLLGIYAALGFDGLLHYARAPLSAHTPMMNFTIWFEFAAAAALLAQLLSLGIARVFRRHA